MDGTLKTELIRLECSPLVALHHAEPTCPPEAVDWQAWFSHAATGVYDNVFAVNTITDNGLLPISVQVCAKTSGTKTPFATWE